MSSRTAASVCSAWTSNGAPDTVFTYGPGSWTPLIGDWDANGTDTIGLYKADEGLWYLRNTNSTGQADNTFFYGPAGLSWIGIAGDWDNN